MSRLNELIGELCPDGVEYKKLWEVTIWNKRFNSVDNNKQPKIIKYHIYKSNDLDSMAVEDGNIRIMTTYCSPEDEIKYTTYELAKNTICEGEIIVIPGGGNACIQYHNGEFITADNRIATSIDTEYLNNRFLYFYLLNNLDTIKTYFRGAGIKHPDMSKILEIPVPIPPLPVQLKIVRILGNYNSYGTELLTELTIELTARKKQYEYYCNLLLNFEGERNKKVPWISLGEVCIVQSGGTPSKAKHEYWENGEIKWLGSTVCQNQKKIENVTNYISELGLKKSSAKIMKNGTTLIALVGATIGKIAFLTFEAAINQNIAGVYPKDTSRLNPSYLFYACGKLYDDFTRLSQGKLAMANLSFVRGLKIPIPPLEEQERIVSILDRFDTLCNDMTIGLPAEIEARRKQYEYYRDKLLTFKEAKA
ncbi:restriction endonuclease subunit S [bacterium]|nr:restriction endonuclease subunit S [bacterium]